MTQAGSHPVLDEMLKLGCKQSQVAIAFQVYVDLIDAHCFWDVHHKHNKKLDLIYITARKTKTAPVEVFIPLSVKAKLAMQDIHSFQTELAHSTVTLAVKGTDSTTVLYRIGNGLITPETPSDTKQRKQRKESHFQLAQELRRRRVDIFQKTQSEDTTSKSQGAVESTATEGS